MQLVLRAWREETERSGGRGGSGMSARAWRVRWAPAHRRRKKANITTTAVNAFPCFSSPEEATQVFWRIRAMTSLV